MSEWISLFAIFIALFLFGMFVMRHGLLLRFKAKIPSLTYQFIDHPIKGLMIGTLASALLQSSSAVMVITIGLVSAKMIRFKHCIGLILGANIGTVLTLEILAFELNWLIIPCLFFGALLLFSSKEPVFSMGCFVFGLGIIFVAMHGFETLALPLASIPTVYDWFMWAQENTNLGLFIGIILSSIIQSSSAVSAMAMSFLDENILSLPTSIAIMLGANIGTCATAWLASIGGSKEAKLAAYAHIWINIIGVCLFFPFIELFSELIALTSDSKSHQLVNAAFLFNLLSAFLILPVIGPFSRFIEWIHLKQS